MMLELTNQVWPAAAGRPSSFDLYVDPAGRDQPLLLFAHGFKGFKDWGHWHLLAQFFAQNGLAFLKFNFSHNGVTPEQPTEFVDLDAFGHNNYTKEIEDLRTLLHHLPSLQSRLPEGCINLDRLGLIGHSRGGALALVFAAQEAQIRAVATWASVSTLDYAWQADLLEKWESEGVYYVENARTGQAMPLFFQLYEDFQAHRQLYDVQSCLQHLPIPLLFVHGTADPAVPTSAGMQLRQWAPQGHLHLIHGADHVFGGKHPMEEAALPPHARELAEITLAFFSSNLHTERKVV